MLPYVSFIVGFGLLIKGADLLVDGASSIARRFHVSDLVIGLTVVAFGTSTPELFVNIIASVKGNTEIAIGNVIGSNISNLFLILGVSSVIIYPLTVTSDFKVNLLNVIRGDEKNYTEQAKEIITAAFDDAKNRLEKSGIKSSQVTTKIITGEKSRAEAVVRQARQGGYSTIVVGRRGLSKVEEFSIGRVSNKVVYLSKGLAVWVVS